MFSLRMRLPPWSRWPPPTRMTPSMSRPYARTLSDILSFATQSCLMSVMAPSSGAPLRYASSQAISSSTASPRNSSLS